MVGKVCTGEKANSVAEEIKGVTSWMHSTISAEARNRDGVTQEGSMEDLLVYGVDPHDKHRRPTSFFENVNQQKH